MKVKSRDCKVHRTTSLNTFFRVKSISCFYRYKEYTTSTIRFPSKNLQQVLKITPPGSGKFLFARGHSVLENLFPHQKEGGDFVKCYFTSHAE